MAAYPYYPVGYNPYLPANYQQVASPQPPQNPSTSGIIWVSGAQEAQFYPVAPNNAVALWENNGKTIYLKQADATGKPTIRIFDLIERTDTAPASQTSQDVKMPDYATKGELTAIIESVKTISGDIETMKGDLYGMAGRKKPSRKVEVEDDDA